LLPARDLACLPCCSLLTWWRIKYESRHPVDEAYKTTGNASISQK